MFNINNPFISISKKAVRNKKNDYSCLITELLLFLNKMDTKLCPSYEQLISQFINNSLTLSKEYLTIYSKFIRNHMYSFDNIYINNKDKIVFTFSVEDNIVAYSYDKETKEIYIDEEVFDYILLDLIEDCIEYLSK